MSATRMNRTDLANERRSRAGCRALRYAPNGALVGIYRGDEAGFDTVDGTEPWSTVCEDHANITAHPTLEVARSWVDHPGEWCAGCQAEA